MASFKVTIEKVDDGATSNGSFVLYTRTQAPLQPDVLPVEIILKDDSAYGIDLPTLKSLIVLAAKGKMTDTITTLTVSLNDCITAAEIEHNP